MYVSQNYANLQGQGLTKSIYIKNERISYIESQLKVVVTNRRAHHGTVSFPADRKEAVRVTMSTDALFTITADILTLEK